jgi:hypothetical protein
MMTHSLVKKFWRSSGMRVPPLLLSAIEGWFYSCGWPVARD